MEINISQNKLDTLPSSMGDLLEIERIDASRNRLKSIPSNFYRLFGEGELVRYTWTQGYKFWSETSNEAKINLQDNPDLNINPYLAKDHPHIVKEELKRREQTGKQIWSLDCVISAKYSLICFAEKEQKIEQDALDKAQFEKEKQLRVEENKERRRERKNNEKQRTKNMRHDREEWPI